MRSRAHRSNGFWVLLVISIAVGFAVALPLLAGESRSQGGADDERSTGDDVSASLIPQPVKPAFVPGRPTALKRSADIARWAVVRVSAAVRARPQANARVVGHIETRTPERTSNIVLVLGSRTDRAGALWIRVRLAALGRPQTGWVRRSALGGYGTVATHLVVDLHSLHATLLRNGRAIFRADVGIGKAAWPTPRGEFYIRNKLTDFASPMYGPVAFGTSARSSVLTDWPAGGYVGIHGTDEPDLLPGRVSHGCIRMRNADILRLAKLMPVGTPLTIR